MVVVKEIGHQRHQKHHSLEADHKMKDQINLELGAERKIQRLLRVVMVVVADERRVEIKTMKIVVRNLEANQEKV